MERRLEERGGKREERERRREERRRGEKAVSLPFYKCGRKRIRKIKIKTCLNAPPIENSKESVSQVQIVSSVSLGEGKNWGRTAGLRSALRKGREAKETQG